MSKNCCYNCGKRTANCHNNCKDYKKYLEDNEKKKQKEKENKEYYSSVLDRRNYGM